MILENVFLITFWTDLIYAVSGWVIIIVAAQSNMQIHEEIKREIKSLSEMADLFVQLRVTIGRALLREKSRKRTGGRAENWNRLRRVGFAQSNSLLYSRY